MPAVVHGHSVAEGACAADGCGDAVPRHADLDDPEDDRGVGDDDDVDVAARSALETSVRRQVDGLRRGEVVAADAEQDGERPRAVRADRCRADERRAVEEGDRVAGVARARGGDGRRRRRLRSHGGDRGRLRQAEIELEEVRHRVPAGAVRRDQTVNDEVRDDPGAVGAETEHVRDVGGRELPEHDEPLHERERVGIEARVRPPGRPGGPARPELERRRQRGRRQTGGFHLRPPGSRSAAAPPGARRRATARCDGGPGGHGRGGSPGSVIPSSPNGSPSVAGSPVVTGSSPRESARSRMNAARLFGLGLLITVSSAPRNGSTNTSSFGLVPVEEPHPGRCCR